MSSRGAVFCNSRQGIEQSHDIAPEWFHGVWSIEKWHCLCYVLLTTLSQTPPTQKLEYGVVWRPSVDCCCR